MLTYDYFHHNNIFAALGLFLLWLSSAKRDWHASVSYGITELHKRRSEKLFPEVHAAVAFSCIAPVSNYC